MKLPEFSVKKPVTTLMIFISIIVLGAVSYSMLGIDLMPKLEVPAISVITTYPGAGALDVETNITTKIEESVGTIQGLDKVESVSQEGLSVVSVKFDWGQDMDAAANDIRDKIAITKPNLPEDANDPIIFKFDLSMMPVLFIGANAGPSYPELQTILQKKIVDPLKTVPGVATAFMRGGIQKQIRVDLDLKKLDAYNLSTGQIANALKNQNINMPAGHLESGQTDFLIRTPEDFADVNQIKNVTIAVKNGASIYLKDIATIFEGFREKTREMKIEGKDGILIMVQKQSGANTVDVCTKARQKVEELKKNLPKDINIKVITDSSDQVKKSINNLLKTLYIGGILVILVLYFFLRNLRSSLIVASAIPTSLIIAFIFLYFNGYTINIMSLSSLVIAIGMVVDNFIVILENIYSYRERGVRKKEAAMIGASEVGISVMGSTFTTVVVFLPMIFTSGFTGIIFRQLAFVVSITIMASLFGSLTLVPMLCSLYLKIPGQEVEGSSKLYQRFYNITDKWLSGMDRQYSKLIGQSLRHRKIVIFGTFILFILTIALMKQVGTEFMPYQDNAQIQISIEMPVGTKVSETGKVVMAIQNIAIKNTPGVVSYFCNWGYGSEGLMSAFGGEEGTNIGRITIRLVSKDYREKNVKQIITELRPFLKQFPGAKIRFSTEDFMARMMSGGGKPLVLELRGYDLTDGKELALKVADTMGTVEGIKDIEISRKEGRPEAQIEIDRLKASQLGLDIQNIARTMRDYLDGVSATKFRRAGDEYDVYLRLKESDRKSFSKLENMFVYNTKSEKIKLSSIAKIKYNYGPVKIERTYQERVIRVTADIFERDLGSTVKEIESKLKNIKIPDGFTIKFGGAREEQQKSFRLLFLALILGIILVYMVMASQFESYRGPFIILFAVPLALMGTVWFLFIFGEHLSVVSFIGMIMLVGVAVNNAIVLIDYTNILKARGYSVFDAASEAGRARLRPILMTTITTLFGLLPLVTNKGEGSESWRPLGVSVIGGLLVSTIIIFIFIPVLYSIFEERMKKKVEK
ncbi:MAG: efflux RND transporter permease subunit [Candidatus Firestonebacteria bacterium]|nr:efflux RND transporter permease subunit [Candidatus Firestonebacteria bacterium]